MDAVVSLYHWRSGTWRAAGDFTAFVGSEAVETFATKYQRIYRLDGRVRSTGCSAARVAGPGPRGRSGRASACPARRLRARRRGGARRAGLVPLLLRRLLTETRGRSCSRPDRRPRLRVGAARTCNCRSIQASKQGARSNHRMGEHSVTCGPCRSSESGGRCGRIRDIASLRVAGSRSWPRTAEVMVVRAGLADPAHGHAHVLALDDHDRRRAGSRISISESAIWVVSRSWTWGRRANTSTRRASLDRPVILPVVGRDVADVRDAVERHQVVLAHRPHLDVLDQDHLVVAEVEGRRQDVLGLLAQAGEYLGVGTRHPRRRLPQALAVRVLADRDQELADGRLGALLVELPIVPSSPVQGHWVGHSASFRLARGHRRRRAPSNLGSAAAMSPPDPAGGLSARSSRLRPSAAGVGSR